MAMVDDQGRLFGRVNLADAVVGVLLLGLVPLTYASYLVFRTPPPTVTAIDPVEVVSGPGHVTIRGENLRPYMRVSFGPHQGKDFLFKSTTEAVINLNEMPDGVYDVILYDFAQERARLPQALTVRPSPLPLSKVIVVGSFGNIDAERAAKLTPGTTLTSLGTIVAVGDPMPESSRINAGPIIEMPVEKAVRLPASLEVPCYVRAPVGVPQCHAMGVVLLPTTMLMTPTPIGTIAFQVDEVRGTQPLEEIRAIARFTGPAAIVNEIRVGDVDRGLYANPLAAGATVTEVLSSTVPSPGGVTREVALRLQAQRGANGWLYVSAPLRAGAGIALRTSRYEVAGVVLQLTPEWTPASAAR